MRQHFYKLAMIVVLGSGFAIAQSMPQKALNHCTGELAQIEPPRFQPRAVRKCSRLDPFQREH